MLGHLFYIRIEKWERWLEVQGKKDDGDAESERAVAKLMEEDMGSAMQYLQGKGLCLMPISLVTST